MGEPIKIIDLWESDQLSGLEPEKDIPLYLPVETG
jgi:hypothetical protein